MTATHPAYRGRGLARWVKQRTLNALAEAGTRPRPAPPTTPTNAPMLALNDALGYQPVARSIRVRRRLPR